MTEQESRSLHLLRVIAVVSIIICHIMQYYKNNWCQIFNIGVQVFWAMSGYLYGKKTIESWHEFYLKRLLKIYLPYIIWVLCVFVVFYYSGFKITINHLFTYLLSLQGEVHYFAKYGLKGLGHLWFLTGLWGCYLLLPFFQLLRRKEYLTLFFIVLFVSIILYGSILFLYSYYLWIFGFAYLYGWIDEGRIKNIMKWIVFVFAVCFLLTTSWEHLQNQYYWRLHHIFIGLACVILFVNLSCLLKKHHLGGEYLVNASFFSYYIYLTHMVWIFGPVSILSYMESEILGVLSVIAATLLSSHFLYNLTKKTSLVLFHETIKSNK